MRLRPSAARSPACRPRTLPWCGGLCAGCIRTWLDRVDASGRSCQDFGALLRSHFELLQRDAGDLDRFAPERDLLADEGGEFRRTWVGRIDAVLVQLLDEARVLHGAREL